MQISESHRWSLGRCNLPLGFRVLGIETAAMHRTAECGGCQGYLIQEAKRQANSQ
jgi:hypothetical protein